MTENNVAEFEAKIWKTGSGSYVVSIPRGLIRCKVLDPSRKIALAIRKSIYNLLFYNKQIIKFIQ